MESAGNQVDTKCCLHIGEGHSTENIILFTKKTVQTCRNKKEIRDHRKKKKSKFDDVILPSILNSTTGYHPSCFRSYCSITFQKTDSNYSQMSVESKSDVYEMNTGNEINDAVTPESENESPIDGNLLAIVRKFITMYEHL